MSDEPKIHIDDDWKSEARREKERLAEQLDTSEAAHDRQPPRADFLGLLNLIAMQAVVGLGGLRDPSGAVIPPHPELAKHHIDLLEVLEQKTRDNLSEDEKKVLDTTLYQLRMAYVELMSALGAAAAKKPPNADTR